MYQMQPFKVVLEISKFTELIQNRLETPK
jgi:hypothetical protein